MSSSRAPFGAQPSQIRTCPIKASGSSNHGFAAYPFPLSAVVSLRRYRDSVFPSSFPSAVPCSGAPFAPQGPSGLFPRFHPIIGRSDFASPVSRSSVAPRYHPCACCSLPAGSAPLTAGPGLFLVVASLTTSLSVEKMGPPKFLGNPHTNMPRS